MKKSPKKSAMASPKPMKSPSTPAKTVKKRQRFTPAERAKILTAAKSGGLTAKQVQTKFGVTPVTYYLWRRKAGVTGMGRSASGVSTTRREASQLPAGTREAVRQRVRSQVDDLVREEVEAYLVEILGTTKRKQ